MFLRRIVLTALIIVIASTELFADDRDRINEKLRRGFPFVPVLVGIKGEFDNSRGKGGINKSERVLKIAKHRKILMDELGLSTHSHKIYENFPLISLKVDQPTLNKLMRSNKVKFVEEDSISRLHLLEGVQVIRANKNFLTELDGAWQFGYAGNGYAIAVLDTGVLLSHDFMQIESGSTSRSKVIHEGCFSTTWEIAELTATCGNLTDEQRESEGAKAIYDEFGSGSPGLGNLTNMQHGTHVAGIAAGKGSNTSCIDFTNVCGVAPAADIISINVTTQIRKTSFLVEEDYCNGLLYCDVQLTSDVIAALDFVATLATTVSISSVNMSFGVGTTEIHTQYSSYCDSDFQSLYNAVQTLRELGIASIASTGNASWKGFISSPACLSNVISVGASDWTGNIAAEGSSLTSNLPSTTAFEFVADFSNTSSKMSFLAPGVNINSSCFHNNNATERIVGQNCPGDGTSAAAPHIAGAFSIIKGVRPDYPVRYLHWYLHHTGLLINHVSIDDAGQSVNTPRVDLGAAVGYAINNEITSNPWINRPAEALKRFEEDCKQNPDYYSTSICPDSNSDGQGEPACGISGPCAEVIACFTDALVDTIKREEDCGIEETSSACVDKMDRAYSVCAIGIPGVLSAEGIDHHTAVFLCGEELAGVGEFCFQFGPACGESDSSLFDFAQNLIGNFGADLESCGSFLSFCGDLTGNPGMSDCGDLLGCAGAGSNLCDVPFCSTVPGQSLFVKGATGFFALCVMASPMLVWLIWGYSLKRRKRLNGLQNKWSGPEGDSHGKH